MTVPAVVDTNIYFSALNSPEGSEGRVIRRTIEGDIVALSPPRRFAGSSIGTSGGSSTTPTRRYRGRY